jgi:CAAX prenyl protease-like protein
MALAARNSAWLTVGSAQPDALDKPSENPVAPYLMPFLMIMAAAMISRAATDGFEWLYPLRFLFAGFALWVFRARYRELDWRFGWVSIAAGAVVFALWLALDMAGGEHAGKSIGTALQTSPGYIRFGWLTIRTLAAVVTVPVAEELAFRGFLLRRLISEDFEAVSWRKYTVLALIVSSVAFGALHGERWLAGSLAGLLYAGAMLWRGRIGDAVVAHATTNALLAAWVLLGQRWSLW